MGTHLNCIDKSMQFIWVLTTHAFMKKKTKSTLAIDSLCAYRVNAVIRSNRVVKISIQRALSEKCTPKSNTTEYSILAGLHCLLLIHWFSPCSKLDLILLSPDGSWRELLKWVRPSACLSIRRYSEMDSLLTQLLLQFLTDLFETLQAFLSWSENLHLVLGLSYLYFLLTFSTFST